MAVCWYNYQFHPAHQFCVVVLLPDHAVVDDDIEENDGHPHGVAKQLKLTLSQHAVVAIKSAKDCRSIMNKNNSENQYYIIMGRIGAVSMSL
jgi:hypothetical protein